MPPSSPASAYSPDGLILRVFDIETVPLPELSDSDLRRRAPSIEGCRREASEFPGRARARAALSASTASVAIVVMRDYRVAGGQLGDALETVVMTVGDSEVKPREACAPGVAPQRLVRCAREQDLIAAFYRDLRCRPPHGPYGLVGFGVKHFDWPFLYQRALILRQDVRMATPYFIRDLQEIWAVGTGERVSLRRLGEVLGCAHRKTGDGSQFSDLWAADTQGAVDYALADLELTAEITRLMVDLGALVV